MYRPHHPFLLFIIKFSAKLLALLFTLMAPFVGCLSQVNFQVGNHHSFEQQKASKKEVEIEVHGILLWASMGFLMPAGILVIRIAACTKQDIIRRQRFKIFYYIHATFQVLSIGLATFAAVISIRSFENSFKNCHQRIGLALYAAIYLQFLLGLCRPRRGTRWRKAWYLSHWITGVTTSIMGIVNTYMGLKAYHLRTSKSVKLWTILFTGQVCIMGFIFILQDKWDYIQTQGAATNDEQIDVCTVPVTQETNGNINSNNNNNEDQVGKQEPRRKSNSLGAYFVKYNALNKLFQLT